MAKNIIKINEAQLKKVIAESVKKTLNEMDLYGLYEKPGIDLVRNKHIDEPLDAWKEMSNHREKLLSNPEYRKNWKKSMYEYWGKEGLSKEEIKQKIQQELEKAEKESMGEW